ncbi:hypothetical protein K503DRAFT_865872 [Rhizopogon vinicolor AM-OR11-026]|uniref:F-box domain-containing protein n=1 Tax=Rhizopogon vinicolor AM-OR11-026 TaxID=1314800 RepID=A0A1B7N1X8_9AGAM|nr:hypothetical protein K503DRAFT_865872 [Rhizopogon vinicolor AM-OR11-026]
MRAEFLSLPTELICHILLLLTPRDLTRCTTTCKKIWDASQNSVYIQYTLELFAQGFTETATLDSISVSRKMGSLEKLASLWRSDFDAKIVFEEVVGPMRHDRFPKNQYVKCGLWWIWAQKNLFIRDCDGNIELSRTWRVDSLSSQHQPGILRTFSLTFEPLQDLVVAVLMPPCMVVVVTDAGQEHSIFQLEFRSASSLLPHPDSLCTSLECEHAFGEPGDYFVFLLGKPAICGDRVVVLYHVHSVCGQYLSVQVIDWRKGHAKSYRLSDPVEPKSSFHLVDEQTMVVIEKQGHLSLYTLQGPDGLPQHRVTYLLPNIAFHKDEPSFVIHATPSFYGTITRPDLIPCYIPSLESQIMVLEILSHPCTIILVIDMVMFSRQAIHAETPVEIPWSDWGPQYTCCFPHHTSHRVGVFGSKVAYALPQDRIPEPGERLEGFSDDHDHFYVHVWDFNKRVITRAKNASDCSSPPPLVHKPGPLDEACFIGRVMSNHPYTATVCRTPFMAHGFERLFLEQDRLVLSWASSPSSLSIQVVCPVDGTELTD